ncbi:MAG: hypothetical protein J0M24_22285 [Verrucomicrobia bacterium]|nr:hypothetical protein [Verrucomicrobiota bacterium]
MKLESENLRPRATRRWAWTILGVSLGLNLLLLLALWWPKPFLAPAVPDQPVSAGTPRSARGPVVSEETPVSNASRAADLSTPWSRLVSTNVLEFAARLREAGCPDQTVCDILSPRIRERIRRDKMEAEYAPNYWAVGAERRRLEAQTDESMLRLNQEEARLGDALGCSDALEKIGSDLRAEWVLIGFLDPSRLPRLAEALARESRWVKEQDARTGGILLPEERTEILARRARFEDELGRWITPAELEELVLRAWVLMEGAKQEGSLSDLELSGHEFREYCRIMAEDPLNLVDEATDYGDLLGLPDASLDPREQNRALQKLLGDERYRQYRQAEDSGLRAVQELARESGQDLEFVQPAFDMVERLRSEWIPEVQQRWTDDPVAGLAELRDLRNQIQEELLQRLAGLPEDRVRSLVGDWLNDAIRESWSQP